jgi:predicted transcriptional regulator
MASGQEIANSAQVQDKAFLPAHRGRSPMVAIEPIIDTIKSYSPEWVLFEIPSNKEANSVLRQLGKIDGMETSAKINREGEGKKLYARYKPKRRSPQ